MKMSENNIQDDTRTPKIALASLYFGMSSLIALLISFVLGILVESIGIVSFFGLIFVLAVAAIVCGAIAKSKIGKEKSPGKRIATTGLVFGLIALFLTFLLRIAIFMFFIPWLGA
jgi:hypothetical protein